MPFMLGLCLMLYAKNNHANTGLIITYGVISTSQCYIWLPHFYSVANMQVVFRDRPIMLIFLPIICSAQNFDLQYYAQYYAHVKELCVKSDCSIRVYSLLFKFSILQLYK